MLNRRAFLFLGAAALGSHAAPAAARIYRHLEHSADPVLFWNAVTLDLVALDHSIDMADARAPGPCASARAVGVVHAVIADAVYFACGSPYGPQYHLEPFSYNVEVPELFIGGAAAGILSQIYNTPTHAYQLGLAGDRFRKRFIGYDGNDWQAGVAFGTAACFRALWNWDSMQRSLLPKYSNYVPKPRRHNIDPLNASQGFYGTDWGTYRPLVLSSISQVAALGPEEAPPEGSPEYERDLAEVRVKGALVSRGDQYFAARTLHETNIGLFWAYDGSRLLGTPTRLYNQILKQIVVCDRLNLVEAARLFALCNLAMADAGVVAWRAKYVYDVWRPILGIQNHARYPQPRWSPLGSPRTNRERVGQLAPGAWRETAQCFVGAGLTPDADALNGAGWRGGPRPKKPRYGDAAFTPNFPSYPSGHATFGGACFGMLQLLRRERPQTRHNPDAIDIEVVSDELNGVSRDHFTGEARPLYPLRYRSIDDMIHDNDVSRIYLGVHWRFDSNRGSESGRRVAKAIYDMAYPAYRPVAYRTP